MKAYKEVTLWNSFLASKQDGSDHSASRFASLSPKKDSPTPIKWEAGWSSGSFWKFWRRGKFLVPAGIRTLRRPARNLVTINFFNLTLVVQELQDWKSVEEESLLCQLRPQILHYSTFFHSLVSFLFIIGHTLIKHYSFRYTQWPIGSLCVISKHGNFSLKSTNFSSSVCQCLGNRRYFQVVPAFDNIRTN